jgi:hypothetical protein
MSHNHQVQGTLPKLIHLLTSLPNLKQSLFNDLNKLFFNFIWDGKPEKIKRNTLKADFEDGGLNMIHLQQFNAYLKISWIKRFFSNLKGGWQKIMAKNIEYYEGERIFSLQKEKISVFITVTFPRRVSFLCCQLFNIFETSIIFFLKFRSGIELRSREKFIPSSLKLDTDQFNLKSGQRI